MRRVLIIGSGGAGKSTLAVRVGAALQIPVVHLDSHFWKPGWVALESEAWKARVGELAAADSWVMDGNYGGTLAMRIDACDTVIFLDMPRLLCIARVLKRWARYRGRTRPDMTEGCIEKVDWEFIVWLWNYPRRSRPEVLKNLDAVADRKHIVILRSRRSLEQFVAGLGAHPVGASA